ncbi:MAG: hypothetical protein HC902_05070 [Calothrix sp. SM1_5_4]|nr:hypothetical protein [Calothrix sp. SM1_5_4]
MKSFSGAIGYVLVAFFLYIAVTKVSTNPQLFMNMHGIGIVVGGLIVAAIASFPHTVLYGALKSVWRSMTPMSQVDPDAASQTVAIGAAYQKGLTEVEKESAKISHPFLSQAVALVLEGLNSATIMDILNKRIEEKRVQINTQMNVMLTLSKYSPALGLAATVLGLVDLLGQLESADMVKLGYGMAIALSATFYGIVLSNLVFAPLSEMINSTGEIETKEMEMIREGIQAGLEGKHALIVGEIVNSYLDEGKRVDFINNLQVKKSA